MKFYLKLVIIIIGVVVVLGIAQNILKFNLGDMFGNLWGGSKLSTVNVNVGQEIVTPAFEIVSLEIFYPNNISIIEVDKMEWWRLSIGTVFIFVEYDSYVKLGIKKPESIRIERVGNTVYVDTTTIVIELLDVRLNNYQHIRTFASNPLVIRQVSPEIIFQAQNEHEKELMERMIERGKVNFDSAKRNFMENYSNMCKAMGLEVIWR
jgi:hypothetical protein